MAQPSSLNRKNLGDFDKANPHDLRPPRRASIASRRSSDGGMAPMIPMNRRLSRTHMSMRDGNHHGMKSAISSVTSGSNNTKPRVKYENTYRMEPGSKFKPGKCGDIISEILDAHLDGAKYESSTVSMICKRISEDIKFRVKDMKIPRFKIVCQVFIGSKCAQSMEIVSRAVWDDKTDNFISRNFENDSLFAVATVHCSYFE